MRFFFLLNLVYGYQYSQHLIHEIQTQWQLLDLSSKPASKSQWLNFNNLTNKAWEPCKEYFNEIKEIKLNNALERKKIILKINQFVSENTNKWPETKKLILFLQNTFKEWQRYAPVLDNDLDELKRLYFEAKKPINNEIKKQEMLNREKKELLLNARKTSYDKLINLGFTKIESELLTKYVEPKEEK